jgi:hypothetical protein
MKSPMTLLAPIETVDETRLCPACGGRASLEYRAGETVALRFGSSVLPWPLYPQGLILRACERCGYRWWELPLNHDPHTPR